MDGVDVLADFNYRIAYEIRLREAIDRNLLCSFHYFGVSDETDLSQIKWQSGQYDIVELGIKFIGNEQRNSRILKAIDQYVSFDGQDEGAWLLCHQGQYSLYELSV